jgi:hypothetical protein
MVNARVTKNSSFLCVSLDGMTWTWINMWTRNLCMLDARGAYRCRYLFHSLPSQTFLAGSIHSSFNLVLNFFSLWSSTVLSSATRWLCNFVGRVLADLPLSIANWCNWCSFFVQAFSKYFVQLHASVPWILSHALVCYCEHRDLSILWQFGMRWCCLA